MVGFGSIWFVIVSFITSVGFLRGGILFSMFLPGWFCWLVLELVGVWWYSGLPLVLSTWFSLLPLLGLFLVVVVLNSMASGGGGQWFVLGLVGVWLLVWLSLLVFL